MENLGRFGLRKFFKGPIPIPSQGDLNSFEITRKSITNSGYNFNIFFWLIQRTFSEDCARLCPLKSAIVLLIVYFLKLRDG